MSKSIAVKLKPKIGREIGSSTLKLLIMLFSNATKCSLLCSQPSPIIPGCALNKNHFNVASIIHVQQSLKFSLFCYIEALWMLRSSLPWSVPVAQKKNCYWYFHHQPFSLRGLVVFFIGHSSRDHEQ